MDLEAQTLSELRSFYALSIYIGFGSRFCKKYGFVGKGKGPGEVGWRSIEVDRNRKSIWVCLVVLMDLEAQSLSELKYVLCSIDLYWFRGPGEVG